ncbi:MAG: tetratricopeptide repeat protein [Elusimicrobiaceae bacterium]|nr:tetratricopeptide repeat protein [Elusimicrobiaceae bacterium]
MRYSKRFFLNSLLFSSLMLSGNVWAAHTKKLDACLEEGKQAYSTQQFAQAKEIFERCVKISPRDAEARMSLAGILLTLEDLDGAEASFKAALKEMKRTSPYVSYAYSMLGDIALKRQRNDEAFDWYTKSLESNAANVNSLIGKGVIREYQGDKKGAAEFYRSALAVEPLNLIARKRLINLEPEYFTDEEILDALKQRFAVQPEVTELSEELRKLFSSIHQAEQRRGVDYLKSKFPRMPADYIVTLEKGTDFEREILTLAGYKALQKHIGQDAIAVFQQAGVPIQEVFKLRDLKGGKVFNQDNTLTESGYFVYTETLKNRKAFLRPNESLPPSKKFLQQLAQREAALKKAGYMEISRKELKFIEKKTKCSLETLRSDLGLYVLPVTKTARRYFIIARETPDPKKSVPFYYLMKERAKVNKSIKVPRNSLVESYAYYGYTVCLDDGKPIQ